LTDGEDWRNPQIVVSQRRRPQWIGVDEVNVYLDACEGYPESPPLPRVIAVIESYGDHRFALSDFDPWNQERFHPPPPLAQERRCLLPRPPVINIRASLRELDHSVNEARLLGQRWENSGKYYFIPPAGWQAQGICKADWRSKVFTSGWLNGRRGPVDYRGRVWRWAGQHGQHWDLQLVGGDHMNINQNGDEV
jgi:hypothetical protein